MIYQIVTVICSEKFDSVAKYILLENNTQSFFSKYILYLSIKKELEKERILIEIEKLSEISGEGVYHAVRGGFKKYVKYLYHS